MPKVSVLEYNKNIRKYEYLAELNLASIPTVSDKIVIDIHEIGCIFKVLDVHYADNEFVDIFVTLISTIDIYNSRRSGE